MSRRTLKEIVKRLATTDGVTDTGLKGVQLYRVSNAVNRLPAVYTPRLCLNVSGAKRVFVNGESQEYGEARFVCCTMPVPVDADIPKASEKSPLLGISIEFDERMMAETAMAMSAEDFEFPDDQGATLNGLTFGSPSDDLVDSLIRLLQSTEDPVAMNVLGEGRLRETYYAILRSEAGSAIRQRFSKGDEISSAIRFIKENIQETLAVEELARRTAMSRAVFHRKFKAATGMSPLQFIKSLRLNTAAINLISGMRVNEAAAEVGYESSSQFSREFKRQFGMSPRDWELEHGSDHRFSGV